MIIDTSTLVSILDQEPEAERFVCAIAQAPERMLSAAGGNRHFDATKLHATLTSCWQNLGLR
jgi:uncharacterized protein with PIN domain